MKIQTGFVAFPMIKYRHSLVWLWTKNAEFAKLLSAVHSIMPLRVIYSYATSFGLITYLNWVYHSPIGSGNCCLKTTIINKDPLEKILGSPKCYLLVKSNDEECLIIMINDSPIDVDSIVSYFHFVSFLSEGLQLQGWGGLTVTGDCLKIKQKHPLIIKSMEATQRQT